VPRSTHAIATQIFKDVLTLPINIPRIAAMIEDEPQESAGGGPGVQGGVIGGVRDGVQTGLIGNILAQTARIEVVRPPEVVEREPVKPPPVPVKPPRITQLRMATPILKVEPVYPALARQARVSGVVELLGVLGTDGRIHELRVLRGHPLLINAALEAVRQWVFAPTVLNGQAVEVAAPITVNFILNQ
jgi:protein TonB